MSFVGFFRIVTFMNFQFDFLFAVYTNFHAHLLHHTSVMFFKSCANLQNANIARYGFEEEKV